MVSCVLIMGSYLFQDQRSTKTKQNKYKPIISFLIPHVLDVSKDHTLDSKVSLKDEHRHLTVHLESRT